MKRMIVCITVFCMLFAAAAPSYAAERSDISNDAANKYFDTLYRWNILYVDLDTSLTDPESFTADLNRSGLVDRVASDDTSFVYIGEKEENTVFFSVSVRSPYTANNLALRAMLQTCNGVKSVRQPVYARFPAENTSFSDLQTVIVTVDRQKCDPAAAAGDIGAIEGVHTVQLLEEEENVPGEVILVSVEYPVEENCPAVLRAVREKNYVRFATPELLCVDEWSIAIETGSLLEWETDYEEIHFWNRIYAALDTEQRSLDEVTAALNACDAVNAVWTEDGFPSYMGEAMVTDERAKTAWLIIDVRFPYRENNEKVVSLLEQFGSAVFDVCHPVIGCVNAEEGTYFDAAEGTFFDFGIIEAAIDLTKCDEETALRELSALPFVRSVDNVTGEENAAFALFYIFVRYPVEKNGPIVLQATKEKPYVALALFERFANNAGALQEGTYSYGDVNCDGRVSADDARQILRFSVNLDTPGSYLVEVLADIDCSGSVTAADARLALRTAVGLNPKNEYTYSVPRYAGLIAGKSVELAKQGEKLLITASTTGSNAVTKCGFRSIKLQKLVDGVWTDMKDFTWKNQFNNTNSKVFSVAVSVPKGNTYRVVCEHYAEAPYLLALTQSAVIYNTSKAVTM